MNGFLSAFPLDYTYTVFNNRSGSGIYKVSLYWVWKHKKISITYFSEENNLTVSPSLSSKPVPKQKDASTIPFLFSSVSLTRLYKFSIMHYALCIMHYELWIDIGCSAMWDYSHINQQNHIHKQRVDDRWYRHLCAVEYKRRTRNGDGLRRILHPNFNDDSSSHCGARFRHAWEQRTACHSS